MGFMFCDLHDSLNNPSWGGGGGGGYKFVEFALFYFSFCIFIPYCVGVSNKNCLLALFSLIQLFETQLYDRSPVF